jgi:broad specificity phosphatase PhoE
VQARRAARRLAETVTNPNEVVVLASRRRRSIDTAEAISMLLGIPAPEETCDLCEMHPGAAEGLTQDEMAERLGPNYAFVPGAESWTAFVQRATEALERIAGAHRGQTVIGVTESGVIKASAMVTECGS